MAIHLGYFTNSEEQGSIKLGSEEGQGKTKAGLPYRSRFRVASCEFVDRFPHLPPAISLIEDFFGSPLTFGRLNAS